MKSALLLLSMFGFIALSGCATSSKINLPDGSQGYRVNCDGTILDWGTCYEKAGKLCGQSGYVLVGQNGESYQTGATNITNAMFISSYGSMVSRYMLVRCKGDQSLANGGVSQKTKASSSGPKIYADTPKYRFDDKIKKIAILGTGELSEFVQGNITEFFLEFDDISVVQPGNIESALGGAVIHYGTGLNPSQSQVLSQMLQIDHLVIFQSKFSDYKDYSDGGTSDASLSLKIVNTYNGEILYQETSTYGLTHGDPKSLGYTRWKEAGDSDKKQFFTAASAGILYELIYALGGVEEGLLPIEDDCSLLKGPMKFSVADKSGVLVGDKLIGVEGQAFDSCGDVKGFLKRYPSKQGMKRNYIFLRDGENITLEFDFPKIPFKEEQMPTSVPEKNKKYRGA